jgi:hypothetical protein
MLSQTEELLAMLDNRKQCSEITVSSRCRKHVDSPLEPPDDCQKRLQIFSTRPTAKNGFMQILAFHQVDQVIGHVPHGSGHEVATTTLVIPWLRRIFFFLLSISRLCDGQVYTCIGHNRSICPYIH